MSELTLEEAKNNLQFNKYELDTAVSTHAILYYEISENLAESVSLRDEAKNLLESEYAEISMFVRNDLKNNGEKVTEEIVKQLTLNSPNYKKSFDKYLDAKFIADEWLAMKEAYVQRGYMLKMMGDLYVTNYFSDITIKGGNLEEASVADSRAKMNASRKLLKKD